MFDAILSKFEKPLNSVIYIDDENQSIHFYVVNEENKSDIKHDTETYKCGLFTDEFFERFDEVLKSYREKNPDVQLQKAALVVPDRVILFDAINVPVIKKAMNNSLNIAINSLYKNSDHIKFNNILLGQNKQYATFSVTGMRKELILKLKKVCEENEVNINGITFETNSIVNGAINYNVDLKNESSIVVDIKLNSTRMAYIVNGKVCGYYSLPFGHAILYKSRLAAEDLIFDHSSGELLVLNAKERAKSRQLTTFEKSLVLESPEEEESNVNETNLNPEEGNETFTFNKSGLKKVARKLPKSMLREAPKSREEFVYENFRIFMKWAQDLIIFNPLLTDLGNPKSIYVNMPKEFDYLYEIANNESLEQKLTYKPLIPEDVYEEENASKLVLSGGLYCKQYNKTNTF